MDWETIKPGLINAAERLIAAIIVFVIGVIIIKFVAKRLTKMKKMDALNPTAHKFMCHFIKGVMYVILVVTLIAIMGVPMASIVAVIASAAAAIGLALQGSLANLAGGIMLVIFKPFKLGDFIETGSTSGTVIDLGVFYTTLCCPDNKHVTIPNSSLTGNSIINYSSESTRRLDIVCSVAYGTDIEKVKEVVLGVAGKHENILTDPEPSIRLTEFSDSSVDFTLKVWVKSENYWNTKFDLLESINDAFKENGIEIPYNKLDVNITSTSESVTKNANDR